MVRGTVPVVLLCRSGCTSPRRRFAPRVQDLRGEPATKRGRACPDTRIRSLWPCAQVRTLRPDTHTRPALHLCLADALYVLLVMFLFSLGPQYSPPL